MTFSSILLEKGPLKCICFRYSQVRTGVMAQYHRCCFPGTWQNSCLTSVTSWCILRTPSYSRGRSHQTSYMVTRALWGSRSKQLHVRPTVDLFGVYRTVSTCRVRKSFLYHWETSYLTSHWQSEDSVSVVANARALRSPGRSWRNLRSWRLKRWQVPWTHPQNVAWVFPALFRRSAERVWQVNDVIDKILAFMAHNMPIHRTSTINYCEGREDRNSRRLLFFYAPMSSNPTDSFPDGHITKTRMYRELVCTFLGIRFYVLTNLFTCDTGLVWKFTLTLMAAQLSTAGEESVPAAGVVRMAYCGDEHGEGVKLSGEEPLPSS